MKRKVTLKQIAKELDVSISTVSKALRNSPEISEDTKEKVQAFAKLYNYKPNNIALSLKNRKTRTIGVIIPEIVHYFFAKVIKGIEVVALERGYNVIIGLCLGQGNGSRTAKNYQRYVEMPKNLHRFIMIAKEVKNCRFCLPFSILV